MVSAISFGVFWRLAPSTMAIMRSRKVSPGLTVTRTTSQSDSTRVPPVTAEKSPPASRITGADSPVMALSSTEATPSITSPSAGSCRRPRPARCRPCAGSRWRAQVVPLRAVRRAARAASSPRSLLEAAQAGGLRLAAPSASASAKLANSTVNHSHSAWPDEPAGASPCRHSACSHSAVVRMLPM
jgi:hypothetical protein